MTSLNSRAHIGQRPAEVSLASTMAFRNVGTLAHTEPGTDIGAAAFQIKPQIVTDSATAASRRTRSTDDKIGEVCSLQCLHSKC